MERHDVLIIGAGLAGLTAAVELHRAGRRPLVLEASDAVGGRVRTDTVDGFLLDRGFQVLLTAYPEARRLLDLEALRLRAYEPGALLAGPDGLKRLADPWRRPLAGVGAVLRGVVGPGDGIRLARLRARLRGRTVEELLAGAGRPSRERLRAEGFSEKLIRSFLQPFLAGVFLDPELRTTDRQLDFVCARFAAGDAAVPAGGMGAIPAQLADRLPAGSLRSGARVVEVGKNRVVTSSGDELVGAAVVVATEAPTSHRLVGVPPVRPAGRHVTCLYFDAPSPPVRGPYLVLDASGTGPVNNVVVPSELGPGFAPPGRALVSVSVLGEAALADDRTLEGRVRVQLDGWFGAVTGSWRRLAVYRIPFALPAQQPEKAPDDGPCVALPDGPVVCGDHTADGSINGAMRSGAAAARAVLVRG